ncbi:hypothetical protein K505DRAFT_314561 [Melanomma pulvis-pyrius CBS 109.77]|uniref:BTB domain-containing protein n=1 Tax=Melanomma pulvis-pyrius CBS 109.77 TaxID=1314802 RepID=A0A6A6WWN0_9PLEO|nr:hypothetical protein K505DRAFT_314561 [Melanomma pulvis-pyrius CBS 109.77]
MADLEFLNVSASPDAELVVMMPGSPVSRICHVSTEMIRHSCPLLYYAFEEGVHCMRQASIQVTSVQVAASFLRFLYTGDYLTAEEEAHCCSLLVHAELCKLAEDYQVPHLQVRAYVNFIHATELSCSFPTPPLGLCEAVQYIYSHPPGQRSRQQQSLVEALLSYCLSSFNYHGLGENQRFRQIVFETPIFHKNLCETSMARNFLDEGAADIICLPVCKSIPHSQYNPDDRDFGDIHFNPFCDSEPVSQHHNSLDEDVATRRRGSSPEESVALALRPKHVQESTTSPESEPSSDEEGYTLVRRPKSPLETPLAVADSIEPTPSEDDWTFETVIFSTDEDSPLLENVDSNTPWNDLDLTPSEVMDTYTDDEWSLV